MRRTALKIFPVFLAFLVIGCAGRTTAPADKLASVGPTSEIESQLERLKTEHYDVLAPVSFAKAKSRVEDARDYCLKEGHDTAEAEKKIGEARMELQHTDKLGMAADVSLKGVLVARESALNAVDRAEAAGVENPEALRGAFGTAHNHMVDLAKDLEMNDVAKAARNRDEVIAEFHVVEDKAIEKGNIDVAKRIVDRAKGQGASRYAPATLKTAEETLINTEAFLKENPHSEEVTSRGEFAVETAEHLLRVTLESKKISDQPTERTALWIEHHIDDIEGEMGIANPSYQHQSYSDRFSYVLDALNQMTDEQKGLVAESDELKSEVARSRAPLAIDAKVKELEHIFSNGEAEVLREGDQIILRLANFGFPTGRASLGKRSSEILSKVEDGLEIFPKSQVIVEGHTDDSGSAQKNRVLSQKRAAVVRDYLVDNEIVSGDLVSAVGMGESEPVTTNDSRKGRAMNRRVDIIIEPSQTALAE